MATTTPRSTDVTNEQQRNPRMGSKTRGSCQACANVKVRCSKERPTCSRCEDRGLVCEYLPSKRPGRVPGSTKAANPDGSTAPSRRRRRTLQGEGGSNSRVPTVRNPSGQQSHLARAERSAAEPISPPSTSSHDPDLTTGLADDSPFLGSSGSAMDYCFGSADNSGAHPMTLDMDMMNTGMDLDINPDSGADIDWEALIAQTDFSQIDMLSSNNFFLPAIASTDRPASGSAMDAGEISPHSTACPPLNNRHQSFAGPNFTFSPQMLASPSLLSSSSSSSSSALGLLSSATSVNGAASQECITPCQCMLQALDLVKTLASTPTSGSDGTPPTNNAFAQRIISLNRQAIQVAMTVLECSLCSDDRFVLMALMMATTKILGRYALAAALCGASSNAGTSSQATSSVPTPSSSYMAQESRPSPECFSRLIEIARALSEDSLSFQSITSSTCGDWCPRREDVQRVLQELHGVQRLLTQLSRRLWSMPSTNVSSKVGDGFFDSQPAQVSQGNHFDSYSNKQSLRGASPSGSTAVATSSGSPLATPLPPDMLSQMEENLRRNLYLFSAAMRNVLKNS